MLKINTSVYKQQTIILLLATDKVALLVSLRSHSSYYFKQQVT